MSNDDNGFGPRTGATRVRSAWPGEDASWADPRSRDDDAAATLRALTRLEEGLSGARRALDTAIVTMADRALGTLRTH